MARLEREQTLYTIDFTKLNSTLVTGALDTSSELETYQSETEKVEQ